MIVDQDDIATVVIPVETLDEVARRWRSQPQCTVESHYELKHSSEWDALPDAQVWRTAHGVLELRQCPLCNSTLGKRLAAIPESPDRPGSLITASADRLGDGGAYLQETSP